MSWTTPEQLKDQIRLKWNRGDMTRARVLATPLFPLELRLKKPTPKEVAGRFGDVMKWIDRLRQGSKEKIGYGYTLRWQRINNRVHGANDLPVVAVIDSEQDALRLIRRESEALRHWLRVDMILDRYPNLREWITHRHRWILEYDDQWEGLLAVVDWFVAHPQSGLYLRQLDIPGVDTKFIEAHRNVLTELLDLLLPPTAVNSEATGASNFAVRFGLRQEPGMIRFRILDPELYIHGLSDLTVLPQEFSRLHLEVSKVFITENRINGLAFPDFPKSIVIFGLGYGIERLAAIQWLKDVDVLYWGDIDTHGFGILNRLRAILPQARSFLMDRQTLLAHRDLWVREPDDKRYEGEPTLLSVEEKALFNDLLHNRIDYCVRLEQERIRWSWLKKQLRLWENDIENNRLV